jgi:hypothetical protein
MRLLLLDTDEAIRSLMPHLLAAWFAKTPQATTPEISVEDGSHLDDSRAVGLIKDGFDWILVNLRLPAMLSMRIAEIIHLAKVPTRLILVSGAPQDLRTPLFDDYIRIPFQDKTPEEALNETLGRPFVSSHRPLASQEHLDLAILNLLQRYNTLAPACRGPLHAFGLYRDAYLHRPAVGPQYERLSLSANLADRIDFFAEVRPLYFSERIGVVTEAVNQSRLYLPWQKRFLSIQFNHLLDAIGLTLMNFRTETEEILKGLEQFGRMAQPGGAEIDAARLRETLLAHSKGMGYVHQGVAQIVSHFPGIGVADF